MGERTKIDWCDSTWNPITGCLHGCEYCYARKIAERFGGCEIRDRVISQPYGDELLELDEPEHKVWIENVGYYDVEPRVVDYGIAPYPNFFNPTFHRYKLDEPQKWKKPRNIFVCSMADMFGKWVPDEWIREVFKACEAAPQHRYLFLTKSPERYRYLRDTGKLPKLDNFWYGTTCTGPNQAFFTAGEYNRFISIEPMLEPLGIEAAAITNVVDWVIIGAETGRRKGKVVPEKAWIDDIARACGNANIPVFMKESLRGIMGDDFKQEFPWR